MSIYAAAMEGTQLDILSLSPNYESEIFHLMRGRSRPIVLSEQLHVSFRDSPTSPSHTLVLNEFLNSYPDARCTFKPTIKGVLHTATNEYEGYAVRINLNTGAITAGLNPSDYQLYNFTVIASLIVPDAHSTSSCHRAYVRIHLHNHVEKAWLSPSRMSVPRNTSGFAFSVFVQFDDQTIVRLRELDVNRWSSNPPDKLNAISGFINLRDSEPIDSPIDITATLKTEFADSHGDQVQAVGQAISYDLPRIAQLIPGSPGYEKLNEVPNFLFLAEGFQAADRDKFDSMINYFLQELRNNAKFKPFNLLIDRMNFWKVFVPSTARGIGTRFDVSSVGPGRARPVPTLPSSFDISTDTPTTVNDLNGHAWDNDQVLLYFGLPVLEHKTKSNSEIRTYWQHISHLSPELINNPVTLPDALIERWKSLGDRQMVDESDTFLGTYYGAPSKVKASSLKDPLLFQLNEHRFDRLRLNGFLLNLKYQDENGVLHPIGAVWDMTVGSSPPTPNGKDWDNIIILLCSDLGRAVNLDGLLYANIIGSERGYISTEADAVVNAGFSGGRAIKMTNLAEDRLLNNMPLFPGKVTLLHEICHSLGLDDEYGEGGITRDDPFFLYTNPGDIELDKHYSNVQAKSDLLVLAGGNTIDADKIKWRWHRIDKSAVLAPIRPPSLKAIAGSHPNYTIKVKPEQARLFAAGDSVFLRRRKLGESILQDISYSQISPPRYPFVTRSPELRVCEVRRATDEVIVQSTGPAQNLPDSFPAESVLYAPLRMRAPISSFPAAGTYLELTAPNLLGLMDGLGRPLHERRDATGQLALDFDAEQSPNLPGIAPEMWTTHHRRIVGLYAGGRRHHHGIYHPTGHCIMRDNTQIAELCSVCKYILTDFIDPSKHPQVDVLIREYYPFIT